MNIGVFCASADQIDPVYFEAATELGEQIVTQGWNLVYGGTSCGLMKQLADTVMQGGGKVIGVIPQCIVDRGVVAREVTELVVTPDMKERKQLLREKSDAFIAMPGGWGTLEEITEVITLKQLGMHNKPIVFLDTCNFYEYFFLFIHSIRKAGFISEAYDAIFKVVSSVEEAVNYIENYQADTIKSKY